MRGWPTRRRKSWAHGPGRRETRCCLPSRAMPILAVGSVTDAGEITLNYVAPAARFRGVSRALPQRASKPGRWCEATAAASSPAPRRRHRFYQSAGYVDNGVPTGKFGTSSGYPMSKQIVSFAIVRSKAKRAHQLTPTNSREMVGTPAPYGSFTDRLAPLSPCGPAPSARASAAPSPGHPRTPW